MYSVSTHVTKIYQDKISFSKLNSQLRILDSMHFKFSHRISLQPSLFKALMGFTMISFPFLHTCSLCKLIFKLPKVALQKCTYLNMCSTHRSVPLTSMLLGLVWMSLKGFFLIMWETCMIVARGMYHGRRHVLESVKSHNLDHVQTVTL